MKAKFGRNIVDEEEDSEEEEVKPEPKVDLQTLFPEIKDESEAPFTKTIASIKWDEVLIVRKLIAKHGKDNTKVSSCAQLMSYILFRKCHATSKSTTYSGQKVKLGKNLSATSNMATTKKLNEKHSIN